MKNESNEDVKTLSTGKAYGAPGRKNAPEGRKNGVYGIGRRTVTENDMIKPDWDYCASKGLLDENGKVEIGGSYLLTKHAIIDLSNPRTSISITDDGTEVTISETAFKDSNGVEQHPRGICMSDLYLTLKNAIQERNVEVTTDKNGKSGYKYSYNGIDVITDQEIRPWSAKQKVTIITIISHNDPYTPDVHYDGIM